MTCRARMLFIRTVVRRFATSTFLNDIHTVRRSFPPMSDVCHQHSASRLSGFASLFCVAHHVCGQTRGKDTFPSTHTFPFFFKCLSHCWKYLDDNIDDVITLSFTGCLFDCDSLQETLEFYGWSHFKAC